MRMAMSNVVELRPDNFPYHDVVKSLRKLADQIENGEIDSSSMTCSDGEGVWHFGELNDSLAAVNAIWNLNFAIHFLMTMASKARD